ncbi:MFS transporter [Rhodococcus sp. IEGM 1401]|uniref:MFS transporter n=1 Tax=unclassified Rhodococcus (in: high G+C Gram-positive bacteria) TaxID=192944 RepID=UPI0022B56ED2|nr:MULTISPECIES: MFS transporter [unclassified Rhodococcus (in: high G+C Gram-positive bacteria)]MCZ4560593.1 MFS transporter [Rhodococcus sp. IEGM 1401]MDI9920721.1 MFS transporter [Rhodococcus sp. IEGM 1372]MDV8033242.1 MFS transporter [Rhodococcus sp. IEGM 1414]
MPHRYAFWVVGVAFLVLMASASAPSPLYPVYQQAWGFSALTLTVIFAVYAVALLSTLLTVGSLSDHIGRKPILIASLILLAVSLMLFIVADSVPVLLAARVVQGIAAGAATGALSAAVIDLQPDASTGPLLNSVAPSLGLASGALGAGLLVQLAPAPDILVFALLIGAALILAVALLFVPETSALRGFDSRRHLASTLLPRMSIPTAVRAPFLLIAPALFATWSLGGFHLSLGPSIIGTVFDVDNHIVGGLEIFAMFASGAVAAAVVRNGFPRTVMMIGATVLAAGVALSLASVQIESIVLYFVGAVIAGSGWGATFLGSMRTLGALVPAAERGGVFATTFVISYLAFSLPAVVAGLAVHRLGLSTTVQVYGGFVITLALISVLGFSLAQRRDR